MNYKLSYKIPIIFIYVICLLLQFLELLFYSDYCVYDVINIFDFDTLLYITITHFSILVVSIPFMIRFHKYVIYNVWLVINIIFELFYIGIGTYIYISNDKNICLITSLYLICSGIVLTLIAVFALVKELIDSINKNKNNKIDIEDDKELRDIIKNPQKSFNENSVIRNVDGSIRGINL